MGDNRIHVVPYEGEISNARLDGVLDGSERLLGPVLTVGCALKEMSIQSCRLEEVGPGVGLACENVTEVRLQCNGRVKRPGPCPLMGEVSHPCEKGGVERLNFYEERGPGSHRQEEISQLCLH